MPQDVIKRICEAKHFRRARGPTVRFMKYFSTKLDKKLGKIGKKNWYKIDKKLGKNWQKIGQKMAKMAKMAKKWHKIGTKLAQNWRFLLVVYLHC
jgi:hypothetical protein